MGDTLRTPYFLVDEGLLKKNLEILRQVAQEAGCKILLAQKAFSMFACYPLISRYLSGRPAPAQILSHCCSAFLRQYHTTDHGPAKEEKHTAVTYFFSQGAPL